jgi:hypothetical protein
VLKKLLVHARHLIRIDKMESEFESQNSKFVLNHASDNEAKKTHIEPPSPLTISKNQDAGPALDARRSTLDPFHGLRRCSS